jgi:hypothetical protein
MTAGVYFRDGRALVGPGQFRMLFTDTTNVEAVLDQEFFRFPMYNAGWGCPDVPERGTGCRLKIYRVVACVHNGAPVNDDYTGASHMHHTLVRIGVVVIDGC